jgi:predicted PurR-regulated permease PerM
MQAVAGRIHVVVGQWLRGQLILIAFVSVIVSIVLGPILHLPNALALGVMTGLFEVITFIGPIIAGAVVGIVALSSGGPTLALTAVVFLFVLRQIEDVVIMPNVLGRAVHLHPLVALFAVVVGSTAFGIVGDVPGAAGRRGDQRRAPRVLPRRARRDHRGRAGRGGGLCARRRSGARA